MKKKSIGFIGGGRITRIMIESLRRSENLPEGIIVSDQDSAVLQTLKADYPFIRTTKLNSAPAECDIVFISLHPPVIIQTLKEIKEILRSASILISLAPKITISKIQNELPQINKIVRMIPNAPSIINLGYNPVSFSDSFTLDEKKQVSDLLSIFGQAPEVKEENLEAYAIIAAMGPTYLWFQLFQLQDLGLSFGLSKEELEKTIPAMVCGAVKTMFKSGLSSDDVMNLVPVKPLKDSEENIKNIYMNNLQALFAKLKN
jgi:pyrroline-5-carboxylate reductase